MSKLLKKLTMLDDRGETEIYINPDQIESLIPDPDIKGCTLVYMIGVENPYIIVGTLDEVALKLY